MRITLRLTYNSCSDRQESLPGPITRLLQSAIGQRDIFLTLHVMQVKEAVLVEFEGAGVSYAETCRIALKAISRSANLTVLQICRF